MATAIPTRLLTVKDFLRMPRPAGVFDYELHHGELVQVTRPKRKHHSIQTKLVHLLTAILPAEGYLSMEVPFHVSERDLRVADAAYVSSERWAAPEADDILKGAPELVIEILSPSNTASEMYEREELCLKHGCKEFWTVDPDHQRIRIASADGPARFYGAGEEVPLAAFGGNMLAVDAVFHK